MSIFAEILCEQFPNITFPSVNYTSINLLSSAYDYSGIYYTSIRLIYHIYLIPYKPKNKYTVSKYDVLHRVVLSNKKLQNQDKKYFLIKFSRAQKTYSCFRKLAMKFKYKHSKKFEIDSDLCFIKFSDLSKTITISLLENNIIYKFRISDLINIINKSLSNSPNFFAEPYQIKNPYTNLPFSNANLYNIYFKIRQTDYIMPLLFHLYFISNFNLTDFKNNNECYIRDKAIDNVVRNGTIIEHYEYILKMFYVHYHCIVFTIDSHFPKSRIVEVFKKLLKPFLLEEYSLNPYVKEFNKVHIEFNLTLFSQLNPDFGKKIWVRKRRPNQSIMYYCFNDRVIESSDLLPGSYTLRSRAVSASEHRSNIYAEINQINEETEEEEIEEHEPENEEIDQEDSQSEENTISRQNRISVHNGNIIGAPVDYAEDVDDNHENMEYPYILGEYLRSSSNN